MDIGCGSGRLAFAISPHAKKVVGIDIASSEVEKAKQAARDNETKNVEFYVADAESIEFRDFLGEDIDAIGANLCMSPEIIKRTARALKAGAPFIFACFQTEQLKELGGSRFSFGEEEMKKLLQASGFSIEHLSVEKWSVALPKEGDLEREYGSVEWAKRRWEKLLRYVRDGGRTLTQSRLIVKARKT